MQAFKRKFLAIPFLIPAVLTALSWTVRAEDNKAETNKADTAEYLLEYKFEVNQFLHYDVVFDMTMETQISQVVEKVLNKSTSRKHIRVVSVLKDGTAHLEPVIDRVTMTAQFDENDPIEFVSDDASKHPDQFKKILKTIGQPAGRFHVSKSGNVLNVLRVNSNQVPKTGPVKLNQKKTASEPIQNILIPFPEKKIQVGDTWKEDFEIQLALKPVPRKVKLRKTYELISVEDDLATIKTKMVVITRVQDPNARAMLIQRTPRGKIVFDMKRGLIVSKTLEIDQKEIGVFGDASSMHAISRRTVKLVPATRIAAKPAGPAAPQ